MPDTVTLQILLSRAQYTASAPIEKETKGKLKGFSSYQTATVQILL